MRILSRKQLAELPPIEWLVEDLIPAESLCMCWGKSESFKSFILLDVACCIATGKTWAGRVVDGPGDVLYIAAEGQLGIKARIEAWESKNKLRADRVFVVPEPVLARNFEELVGLVKDLDSSPRLVVVDTLSRCLGGEVDENSATGMEQFLQQLDRVRREFGCSVAIVHHSEKTGSWPRGSYAIQAACDSIYQVIREDGSYTCNLFCKKQKDAARCDPMTFVALKELESLVLEKVSK